jgi:putative YphP/YqiW family bacilliredoxin
MRREVTELGAQELRSPEDVDRFVDEARHGTAVIVVNSVCGCAAGTMRPALKQALTRAAPDRMGTVFAGADLEATARAREIFQPYPPSSPFIGVFRDGRLAAALERGDIHGRPPEQVAEALVRALKGVGSSRTGL